MANKNNVCNACGTSSGGGGTNTPISFPSEQPISRGISPIRVQDLVEGGQRIFEISYQPYVAPTLQYVTSPSVAEVGELVPQLNFNNVKVNSGSENISAIVLNPDSYRPQILPDLAFNFSVDNVSSNTPGLAALHALQITDTEEINTFNLGLSVKDRIYQGYSSSTTLTEAEIKALVNSNLGTVGSLYNGTKNYSIPASAINQYIYWAYPDSGRSGIIQSAQLGVLTFPLEFLPSVNVTNTYGVTISYKVVRSANPLGSGTIALKVVGS